jgi:hypothetical protein
MRDLLTADQAAKRYAHASTRAFYEWLRVRRGTLKGIVRRGRRILIDPEKFEASLRMHYGSF